MELGKRISGFTAYWGYDKDMETQIHSQIRGGVGSQVMYSIVDMVDDQIWEEIYTTIEPRL